MKTTAGQLQVVESQWGNIKETIGGMIISVLGPFIEAWAKTLRYLGETEHGMAIVKTAFIALSVAVGVILVLAFKALAVAAWEAIVPMLPFILIALAIIAVITLLVLIIEDLYVWFNGGESVFGRFIQGLKQLGSDIGGFFSDVIDSAMEIWDGFVDWLSNIPGRIMASLSELGSGIVDFFKGLLPDWAIKLIGNVAGQPASATATAVEARAMGGPVQAGQPFVVGEDGPELFVPGKSGNIIPNGGASAGMSINTLVGTINIVVQSATEAAEEIETIVLDALNNLARNTLAAEMGVSIT